MAALVLAVAALLIVLAIELTLGGIAYPLSLRNRFPAREGIELVLFPLVAVLTALRLRSARWRSWVPQAAWMGWLLPL